MSRSLHRSFAELACRALQRVLPPKLQLWGWAIRREVAEIPDDTKALLFALDSLLGLLPRALLSMVLHQFASLIGGALRHPRVIGIGCAIVAVMLGLAYMAFSGAPVRYLEINLGALFIGLMTLAVVGRVKLNARRWPEAMAIALTSVLLATALIGDRAEGAARWVKLGGLPVQPSLILLPVMIVGFARTRNALSTVGMIGAAIALAVQPDRAMAGVLAAGLAVLAVVRPDRLVMISLAAGIIGFATTLVRPDTLSAAPFSDQILYPSFAVHLLAGTAVLSGLILLIVPAFLGWHYDQPNRTAYAVFGTVWLAVIVAAALGNYPTPIVGFGGSAIIGYVLSLTMLPNSVNTCLGEQTSTRRQTALQPFDRFLRGGPGVST